MREQKHKEHGETVEQKASLGGLEKGLPILASVRTGLANKDDAILRRIPVGYSKKTVKAALNYIVGSELTDSELSFAESVKKELNAEGSIVVVNGKTAKLTDKLSKYLVTKEHELSSGSKTKYKQLEMEVSAVQQGGFYVSN